MATNTQHEPRPWRAGIYTRISSNDEQDRLGVQRQEEDGRTALERRAVPVHRVYEDNDISASGDYDRSDYEDLVRDLRNGAINAIWSWDVDRLTRGHREYIELYETCETVGALVIWHGGEANFATGTGLLELEMRAAFAREELRKIKRRTARKHQELAEKGMPHGGGAEGYGYHKVRNEEGKVVTLSVVEDEAAVIRETARRILAGEPLRAVVRDLDRRGVRTKQGRRWGTHSLKRVLTNASISGRREHHGQVVAKGSWPAIIEPAASDRLRTLLLDPSRDIRSDVRQSLLSGMVNCGDPDCGARLIVERRSAKDSRGRTPSRMYVCRKGPGFYGCGKAKITADRLEHTVVERLLGLESSGKLRSILYAERTVKLEEAEAELETVKSELKDLARQRYLKKMMPEEVEGAREALLERRKTAEEIIASAQREMGLPDLPDPLAPAWDDMELHEQRSVLKAALLSIRVMSPTKLGSYDPNRVVTEWKA
jgi:site-specific DNA recombinase